MSLWMSVEVVLVLFLTFSSAQRKMWWKVHVLVKLPLVLLQDLNLSTVVYFSTGSLNSFTKNYLQV